MSEDSTKRVIDEYIKRIARLLPDNFETEDLLDDIRAHIYEALKNKKQNNQEEIEEDLIIEVLDELGTPEEIAEEYGVEQIQEGISIKRQSKLRYYSIRLVAAVIVAILAAWIVSIITEGAIDFYLTVIVLIAFAVIEWFVRAKQIGE